MLDELQRLVDELAKRLGKAVAIDDPHLRLLVYSAHDHETDPVRQSVILTRRAPQPAANWVQSLGIATANGPTHIPASEEFGTLPRLCIPLQMQRIRFGYLWLIDADTSLTDADIAIAVSVSNEVSAVMFRERVLGDRARSRRRELLADLLGSEGEASAAAAEEMIARNAFAPRQAVRVLVAAASSEGLNEEQDMALEHALERCAAPFPDRHAVTMMRSDHVVLLVSEEALASRPATAETLRRIYREAGLPSADAAVVAVGSSEANLFMAGRSYRRAMQAMRIARQVPTLQPVASWDSLGVYGLLVALPIDQLRSDAVHPGVIELQRQAPELVETLELFLDRAGDTGLVANELGIHRSSVYQRMGRIERVTGLNMHDGEHRLAAHLSLKVARLIE